jgi:hypothetical protein
MGATKSKRVNKNQFKKVYPYVRRRPIYTYELEKETVIETARVYFDDVDNVIYTFIESFASAPSVTATAEDEDLNVFITAISTTAITVNTSESFTGYVDIHAIYVAE